MAKSSVLTVIGADIKAVFSWLGSAKAQTIIATGEGIVASVDPAAAGIISIANAGLSEIFKIEALAAGAGQQSGSGVAKSAAVVNALTPEILGYAEQHGFPVPTAAKIQSATNALVAFLNAFDAKATVPAPIPVTTTAQVGASTVTVSEVKK